MVNELKLAVVHFTHQNPIQICACAWIYRWTKNYGKSRLGHWAVAGRGPRALDRGPVFSKTRITIVQNSTSRTELSAIANWKNVVNRVDFMKIPKKYCPESTFLVNSVAPRSLPYCRKKNYTWLISLLQLPVAARNNRRFTGKYNIMTKSSIIL